MSRHLLADVWSGSSVDMPRSDDLWISTLTDIASHWGWLVVLVLVGLVAPLLSGHRRPPRGR